MNAEYCSNLHFVNLLSKQARYVSFMTYKSRYCLVDSCKADSGGYTAFYNTEGTRNIYRHDTSNATSHIVLNINSGSECCGMGFQQDTSCISEYNVYLNGIDGAFDSYYNVNDTVRYCTMTNNVQGLYLNGEGWVCHNNIVQSVGTESVGIQTDLCGTTAMLTKAFNNTVTSTIAGLRTYSCANSGTVSFYSNNVSCSKQTIGNFRFTDLQVTTGVTMTNNSYSGVGTFYAGQWPAENPYNTLALWQATGKDAGSTYSSVWSTGGIVLPVEVTSFIGVDARRCGHIKLEDSNRSQQLFV